MPSSATTTHPKKTLSPVENFYETGSGGIPDRFDPKVAAEIPKHPLAALRKGSPVEGLDVNSYVFHEFANQYQYRETKELASKYNLLHNYGKVKSLKTFPDGSISIVYECLHSVDAYGNASYATTQTPNTDKNLILGTAEGYEKFSERRRGVLATFQNLRAAMVFHVIDQIWSKCRHMQKAHLDVTLEDNVVMKEKVHVIQCSSCGLVLLAEVSMPRYAERPHAVIVSHDAWKTHPDEADPSDMVAEPVSRRRWVHPLEVMALLSLQLATARDADLLRFHYELQPYSWPMAFDNCLRANPKVKLWS